MEKLLHWIKYSGQVFFHWSNEESSREVHKSTTGVKKLAPNRPLIY